MNRIATVSVAVVSMIFAGEVLGQGTNPTQTVRNDVNSEWVQASSPTPGGGRVTTTKFANSDQLLTRVVEPATPAPSALQRPQIAASQPMTNGVVPAVGMGNYVPMASGTGAYLVPTVQYIPMSSNALTSYQAAYAPQVGCANCQTGVAPVYQPTAATQTPVLPNAPAAGNYQVPMGTAVAPGYYNQVPGMAAPAPAASGYKALIPRSLPAGTYIGQGWAGQPKAYVNNQPFRNFFRYLIIP